MNKTKNVLAMIFAIFITMVGAAYADPITVEDVKVENIGGNYVVIVSLLNANTTETDTDLSFAVDGVTGSVTESVNVRTTSVETFTFDLNEVVDIDDLTSGTTYRLTVTSNNNTDSETFLFGSESSSSDGLGLNVKEVEINNVEVADIDSLQVINGQPIEVSVRFEATSDFDNARIRASIDGYEHAVLDASTEIFEVADGKTYVKTLSINLPADMNSGQDYQLRITGANDLSGSTFKVLDLFVDTQRHRVDVLDLVMTPSSGVEPGQNIIANVRLKNRGQRDQQSTKVSVQIPELGITESSYISNLADSEAVTSDDMLIFIPEDATAKQYEVYVNLAYNDGYTESVKRFTINVIAPKIVPEENLLVSFKDNIELQSGVESTFEVVVANPNDEAKPISVTSLDNSWAEVEVLPTLHMIGGGSSATYSILVTPKEAVSGEKELTVFIKEGAETVSEVKVNTYVAPAEGINWLNVVLAVLLVVVIIVLLVLVVTIAKRKGDGNDDDDDMSSNEEYY